MSKWLLPENLADILPPEASRIESLRRQLLDLYRSYGYELVSPPLVEYLDSLLPGNRRDLNLATFKLVDQLSGRTLGVRADMTPQVARIDAHVLNRQGITRLCYFGSVLHTRATGLFASREPLQIGAELYGYSGEAADIEIIRLALESLQQVGLTHFRLDLSHAGIVSSILAQDPSTDTIRDELYLAMRTKDIPELRQLSMHLRPDTAEALLCLVESYGDVSILECAQSRLLAYAPVQDSLATLKNIAEAFPGIMIGIDLGDVSGYQYHSGVMFGIYVDEYPNAIVRGGRYDDIGQMFGRARPATGFSMDLKVLASLLPSCAPQSAIRAPAGCDEALLNLIKQLRTQGDIVIQSLPDAEDAPQDFCCDREIVQQDGQWILTPRTV